MGGAVAAVGIALLAAACGSSATTTTTSSTAAPAASATSSASSSAAPVSAKGVAISTASGSHGVYLTGASGRAIYLWVADSNGMSSCSGACAKVWPPVTTDGTPTAGKGVQASDLSTITRSDGTKQVTYKGHPLYYFVSDTSAGSTTGEGSDSFGAKWWLLTPAGAAITTSASASPGSSSSSSSSAGGGWS